MPNEYALIGLVHLTAPARRDAQYDDATAPPAAERPAARRLPGRFLRVVLRRTFRRGTRLLRLWRSRMRESQELGLLSNRELRDMNVSRYDVAQAERKPFWRK